MTYSLIWEQKRSQNLIRHRPYSLQRVEFSDRRMCLRPGSKSMSIAYLVHDFVTEPALYAAKTKRLKDIMTHVPDSRFTFISLNRERSTLIYSVLWSLRISVGGSLI